MVLRHNYTRSHDTARAGLRYYQMRPRGASEPPRSIFTADGSLTREEAYRLMAECQLPPPAGAPPDAKRPFLCHRIVLAPGDSERPDDLREMTRQVMRELEKDKGMRLRWAAIEHRHTQHHHVHVMLFGAGEDAATGEAREVRLGRDDHARMRAEGAGYCSWEREGREDWYAAVARANDLDRGAEGDPVPGRGAADETGPASPAPETEPQPAREREADGYER